MMRFVSRHRQGGAVLLVAMVMLLILTLIGVAGIDSSGMQTRMANNQRERIIAFQAAEAGLMAAERYLENADLSDDNFGANCNAADPDCFEATCGNGLCFTGTYINAGLPLVNLPTCIDGTTVEPHANPALDVFKDGNGRSVELAGSAIPARVKYYIEFRCFTQASVLNVLGVGNADLLFRITSYAESESGRGRVMLQSTYSVSGS